MRCAECGFYECVMRAPFGGCPYGTKAEQAVIFTAPDTGFHDLGNGTDEYLAELRGRGTKLYNASRELVEAVEKYIQPKKGEFLSRNELLIVLRKVKKIINEDK